MRQGWENCSSCPRGRNSRAVVAVVFVRVLVAVSGCEWLWVVVGGCGWLWVAVIGMVAVVVVVTACVVFVCAPLRTCC